MLRMCINLTPSKLPVLPRAFHQTAGLQEAYKEKDRRCCAWEKAYGHLRAQVNKTDTEPMEMGGWMHQEPAPAIKTSFYM